MNNIT